MSIAKKLYERGNIYNRKVYTAWRSMMSRCSDKNNREYKNYGGRGISVCDSWKQSHYNFLDDIGYPPSKLYSVDRIDNNGNYEPGNVRWATQSEQNRNQTSFPRNKSGVVGVFYSRTEDRWRAEIKLNGKKYVLGRFHTFNAAVSARRQKEKEIGFRSFS